jgi:hypothetical protein
LRYFLDAKMAGNMTTLEALRTFYSLLLSITEGRYENLDVIRRDDTFGSVFETELAKIWKRPERKEASRTTVNSGKPCLPLYCASHEC